MGGVVMGQYEDLLIDALLDSDLLWKKPVA